MLQRDHGVRTNKRAWQSGFCNMCAMGLGPDLPNAQLFVMTRACRYAAVVFLCFVVNIVFRLGCCMHSRLSCMSIQGGPNPTSSFPRLFRWPFFSVVFVLSVQLRLFKQVKACFQRRAEAAESKSRLRASGQPSKLVANHSVLLYSLENRVEMLP